ncbi:MAG: phosphatase PAP2 family protein [Rhodothermales bacterium]
MASADSSFASLWTTLKAKFDRLSEHHDVMLLLALAVLAAGVFAFAELAGEVVAGQATSFDESILLAFRESGDLDDPIGNSSIEEAVRDITALGGTVIIVLLLLATLAYFLLDKRPRSALFLLGSVLSGIGVTFILKSSFARPRPDLVSHGMEALTASFPSGHSATAAVVYLTLGALMARAHPGRRLKIFLIGISVFVAIAVGISRVYLGVHWPTDVIAGWTVGATWAVAASLVARSLQHRGWLEPPRMLLRPTD